MIDATGIPTQAACKILEVSRQSFYDWKTHIPRPNDDAALLGKIEQIAIEFPKYGYRRMTKELHRRNERANHKRVLRIMRKHNLLVRKKKFKPITTNSNHGLPVYPNLARGLMTVRLNQLWVADITYVHLPGEFVYLAAILDVYSRKCIGWQLSRNIDATLTLDALEMAIATRKQLGFADLIHHSDRGRQYAAREYVAKLNELGIKISMSDAGNAYDNAYAEAFMKTFKVEEVYIKEYETFEDTYANIKHFIELAYNEKRLHSKIGYVPPAEFENEVLKTQCLN
jgi:putative transposase